MKKFYLISLALISTIFCIITFLKTESQNLNGQKISNDYTTTKKDSIQIFWEIYRQANKYRIEGKLEYAIESYNNALTYDDQHEDALYYLGNVFLDSRKYKEAEKCWKKLIQLNSESSRAHFQLGNLYLNYIDKEIFNIDLAEYHFQKILKINEEESGSVFRLGLIELIRGNITNARKLLEAVSGSNYKNLKASFFNSFIDWKLGLPDKAISRMMNVMRSGKDQKPETDIPGEGDTKSGKPLYIAKGPGRKSLFHEFTYGLEDIDPSNLNSQLEKRYENLDIFLEQLHKKVSL
jgi:tetratricopeptide (TPR) repeat protein